MQQTRVELPRGTRKMPSRTPEFRAADCAAFDAMIARRPLKAVPLRLVERTTTAGKLEAHRYNARAGHLGAAPRDDEAAGDGTHIVVI